MISSAFDNPYHHPPTHYLMGNVFAPQRSQAKPSQAKPSRSKLTPYIIMSCAQRAAPTLQARKKFSHKTHLPGNTIGNPCGSQWVLNLAQRGQTIHLENKRMTSMFTSKINFHVSQLKLFALGNEMTTHRHVCTGHCISNIYFCCFIYNRCRIEIEKMSDTQLFFMHEIP